MRELRWFLVLLVFAVPGFALPAKAWAGGTAGSPGEHPAGLQREVNRAAQRGSAEEAAAYAQREAAAPGLDQFRGGREVTVDLTVLLLGAIGFLLIVLIIVVVL